MENANIDVPGVFFISLLSVTLKRMMFLVCFVPYLILHLHFIITTASAFHVVDIEELYSNNNEFATPFILVCAGGESNFWCLALFTPIDPGLALPGETTCQPLLAAFVEDIK